jgi:CheY-like chemotaxis protein
MRSPAQAGSMLLVLTDERAAASLSARISKVAPDLGLHHARDRQEVRSQPLPSVIVLDLDMAFDTAFEILSWARSQPLYRQVPVIGLTSPGHNHADRAYALGANCCLLKPSEPAQMDGIAQGIAAYASLLAKPS